MIASVAREDYDDLLAAGLPATLEDFDRLNTIALRLECGDETTGANFPRIGWAGDIPFHEPTYQSMTWFLLYADRLECDAATHDTLWAFSLAHARTRGAFDGLETREAIEDAVGKWAASLTVTREEVLRACRYAFSGFDDAIAGTDPKKTPRQRTNREIALDSLARLKKRMTRACAVGGASFEELFVETPSAIDALYEAYAVEHGKELKRDEAMLLHDYKMTLREIRTRLQKAKEG